MVTAEVSSNHQSLQILKKLNWQELDELIKKHNEPKLVLDDPIFMHALATVVQSFCEMRKGYSLSSVMLGYNSNLIVASMDGKNFRYFYDLEYKKLGEEAQSLEASISTLDDMNRPKRYFCYRAQKIKISGKEIKHSKVIDVNEEVTGVFAAVLQHEIENQNFNFLPFYGVEVQIY